MPSDTTPQDRALAALVAKFKGDYVACGFTPDDPRDHSTLVPVQEDDGVSLTALTMGQIVDCLADAGLLCSPPEEAAERLLAAAGRAARVLPPMVATFVQAGLEYAEAQQAFEEDTLALADEILSLPLRGTDG